MKLKICIWMNIPSHHQSAFFAALHEREDVDLQIRYFMLQLPERVQQGWQKTELQDYEICVENMLSAPEKLATLSDWQERIHICCYLDSPDLVNYLVANHVKWCHWSEAFGTRLAKKVHYNLALYNFLYPFYRFVKRKQLTSLNSASLYFAQGKIARDSFKSMGFDPNRIRDLYYTPKALPVTQASPEISSFARNRKVFLTIARLDNNKGCDLLLHAFASLKKNDDWCLVMCGKDQQHGKMQDMAQQLKISEQVLFTGVIPYSSVSSVLAAADVFILASRFDGWGAVLNEAASLSKPLIASEGVGAAWHLIQENKNGFRFKNGSAKALAEKMSFYIEAPALIQAHGNQSKELFDQKFTPAKNAELVVRALEDIL